MKRNLLKKLGILFAVTLLVGNVAACGKSSTDSGSTDAGSTETTTESASSDLSGTITMAGSTSMEKFANALAEAFMQENPGVTVSAEFVGSSAGLEALAAGSVDIGNSSRALKDTETEAGAVENIVALDGIGVVVDTSNKVADLTKEQLVSIYTGEVTNWSEVGGSDMPIVVIGRESGSGTRDAFEELLEVEDKCAYANELDSTGAVMAKVASTKGAIGYVSLDVIDESVSTVSLDGVTPSEDTVRDSSYLLSRPFVMATSGEISEQNAEVKALFEYIESEAGQELIKSVGLITLK